MNLKSINPYTGEVISNYNSLTDQQLEICILNSREAFKTWRFSAFDFRASLLSKLAELLKGKDRYLASIICSEMGKPIREALAEVNKCAWVCDYYASNAEKQLAKEIINTEAFSSYVHFEPLGTILGIMPWNFPFWQVFRFLAPNLMAGNTLLLKHASNVQGCARAIQDLIIEAGFPNDVFQNLCIHSSQVKQVINHDFVAAVTLTGSEYAGSQVAAEAGKCIKKTVLELGGSNAFIVLSDANLEKVVEFAVQGRMMNGGQSCIAAKRFLVQEPVFEKFIDLFVERVKQIKGGDPMKDLCEIGPMSSVNQAQEVERQVNDSLECGASLLVGGERNGAFYQPTVIVDVKPGMAVFDEEVFGPVAPVLIFKDLQEAINLSNLSRYGLGVSVFTNQPEKVESMVTLFDEGAVFINSFVKSDPRLPFGGVKKSGYGRELSLPGIREFVNIKTVYVQKL